MSTSKLNRKECIFNVLLYDFNRRDFVSYNVMPYLFEEYEELKKKDRPKTFDEIKKFIERKSLYRFWGRCEYEIIVQDWPCARDTQKIDAYYQIMMNINIITDLFIKYI